MIRSGVPARFAVACAMALAGCLINTGGLSGGGGTADAGSDQMLATPEAGADVCVPALSSEDAGAIAPLVGYTAMGSAAADGTTMLLTPDMTMEAGVIWSDGTAFFDHFDATIGFTVTVAAGNSTPGDGIGFGWVNAALPSLGNDGASVALAPASGYAVVVSEYGGHYNLDVPAVAVVDLTQNPEIQSNWSLHAEQAGVTFTDGLEHFFHVAFDAGVVSVDLDGRRVIDHFAIPNYVPYTGHWGIGAGTGGSSAAHRVTRVSFADPSSCQ